MELEKIRKIYENVPFESLTQREKMLTDLLFTDRALNTEQLPNGRYRILQFSGNNFAELENTLKLLLPDFVRSNLDQQTVIESFSAESPTKSELFDIFQTLAQDMGEPVVAYIGRFVDKNQLAQNYAEEVKIFERQQTFSEYILSESLQLTKHTILQEIRKKLLENPDDQKLVKALYATNGNQSQAAKNLYVHRNTLINKIKKYEQKYGLQLIGSDLVLAYNLL
ncbi:helix-turn-helix domain-containing protein [Lactococcus kimchii]|uniref:helix-turn-helix domain-containing protein n=1 Tax=Lactococcus sp. S-13 TaxID=2507158 RepID=UPI0010231541|nr:helix-turn-helix domain-containing protein [Lactococcus sp. S-13]RZI48533.1 polyketide synthase regulator [Lactococcus sp. S-13]